MKNFIGSNNKATGIFGGVKMNNVQVETVSERLNRIIEEQRRDTLEMSNKLKALKRGFDVDTISDVFVSQLVGEEGEQSIVGETGNLTNKAETMTHIFLSNNVKSYIKILKRILSTIQGGLPEKGHVYKSPIKLVEKEIDGVKETIKTLTAENVLAIAAEMKKTDLSNPFDYKEMKNGTEKDKQRYRELITSVIGIANDLDVIFRYYQETVIDAAKTGKFIKLELLPKGHKILSQVKINGGVRRVVSGIDENGKEIYSGEREVFIERDEVNTEISRTLISDTQDEYINLVKDYVEEIDKASVKPGILEMKRLINIQKDKKFANIINSVMYCKNTYYALSAEYAEALKAEEEVSENTWGSGLEMNISVAKMNFEKGCALLAQQLRRILKGLTLDEAIGVVMVALYTKDGKGNFNFNNSNGFLINTLKEEYLIYLNDGMNLFKTGFRILRNDGLNNGDVAAIINNIDTDNKIIIDTKKEKFTGLVHIEGVEEVKDENGNVVLNAKGEPVKTNGVAIHMMKKEIPQYADDEIVLTFKTSEKLLINIGDLISVGKTKFAGMRGQNKKFITPVSLNTEEVGSLVCQCNHEKWLKDAKGNVIKTTVINSSYTNKRTMKEVVEYTCIVKIKVDTTIEDIKDLVKVVTTEKSAEYFTPEKLDYQEIFFSDFNEEETTQDTNNEAVDEREVIIEIEREEEKVQEEVQEKEVIIEIENEETNGNEDDVIIADLEEIDMVDKMSEDSYGFNFGCDYDEF